MAISLPKRSSESLKSAQLLTTNNWLLTTCSEAATCTGSRRTAASPVSIPPGGNPTSQPLGSPFLITTYLSTALSDTTLCHIFFAIRVHSCAFVENHKSSAAGFSPSLTLSLSPSCQRSWPAGQVLSDFQSGNRYRVTSCVSIPSNGSSAF